MHDVTPNILDRFEANFAEYAPDEMTISEYLEECRTNPMAYAFASQRMVNAIGDPIIVDTSQNPRLARLFGNREIKTYKAFEDFYGMEEAVESIVDFFRHASQGLEEAKQILYLLGPVGGGKSSLVARLRDLMEKSPIYCLAHRDVKTGVTTKSPYFSRVLPLFSEARMAAEISDTYGIHPRFIHGILGPWERKRLIEDRGSLANFRVLKMYPSRFRQIAISEAEPGDENTQDISTLVGKVDMRKLEEYSQNDPDAYLFSGALNLSNQGMMEFKEMFKAKIKMLNPLLFAVQEHNYQGTENIAALPFDGIVVAHSNEGEWTKFKGNKENEAFLDRICIRKVPYCLRTDEEMMIYQKFINESELSGHPVAPGTLEILAQFAVMSRLKEPVNGSLHSKLRVYNGENLREKDPKAKTYQEYRDEVENRDEGFFSPAISTRWASKRLSQCFNRDPREIAADPVHMLYVLLTEIEKDDIPEDLEKHYKKIIKDTIRPKYFEYLNREIRAAFLDSYADYGQNLFDRYFMWADKWVNSEDFFDTQTGLAMNREALEQELSKIEKPADISNPRDFRNEVVNWVLRYQAQHHKNPPWRAYSKLKDVIEKTMFSKTEELLPVISFAKKASDEDEKKHNDFVQRMMERGYTDRQIRRVVDWYLRVQKS
jgi:serine protein kinase